MSTTFIDTAACPRSRLSGAQGEAAEILNDKLCGAKNVVGTLRWLGKGERFEAQAGPGIHQLVYVMEGSGVITLEKKDYEVSRGAGIYLGPAESASIRHAGTTPLKLFHLAVPKAKN